MPEQPVGDLVGLERGGVDQLLDQERHSLGQLDDPCDTTLVERGPAIQVAHLVGRFGFVEATQRDPGREREPGEVGDAGADLVVGRVLRAHGDGDGKPLVSQRPREVGQQVEAGLVGPVDVLDHQEDGAGLGDAPDHLSDRRVSVGGAARGFEHRIALSGPELRQQPGERRTAGTCGVVQRLRADGPEQVAQHVDEGPERDVASRDGRAVAPHDQRAPGSQLGDQLRDQPALADPGLALDDGDPRTPLSSRLRKPVAGRRTGPPARPSAN